MNTQVFSNIARIVERDSKSTTYKFALLRGVIDIIQENSPYISQSGNYVFLPMGMLVYKWIIYYYPILESDKSIPQIGGASNLAIKTDMDKLIEHYADKGRLSAFNKDIRGRGIDEAFIPAFLKLAKKIAEVIRMMPMKHIGYSINGEHYSVFAPDKAQRLNRQTEQVDLKFLIDSMGTFSIPIEYYEAFHLLGSFISGRDSIVFKWAEFSVNASGKSLPISDALSAILTDPVKQRDAVEASKFYKNILKNNGHLNCVWTGKSLIEDCHIDHIIPYAAWNNNDLWNLLPANGKVNGKKRDKIPSPALIDRRKDDIILCWEGLYDQHPGRFSRELQVSLIGNDSFDGWQTKAIIQLQRSCAYLIDQRGFQAWNG